MSIDELHGHALADTTEFVEQIGVDDLSRSTPCAGWDLGELLAHMIGQNHGFAEALAAGRVQGPPPERQAFRPRPFTGGPAAAWRASTRALAAAVAARRSAATAVLAEIGPQPLPRDRVVRIHLLDTVAHAWDVARALGRPYRPDAVLVAAVLAGARQLPATARTSPDAPFGPMCPDEGGDDWRTALALLGRDGRPRP